MAGIVAEKWTPQEILTHAENVVKARKEVVDARAKFASLKEDLKLAKEVYEGARVRLDSLCADFDREMPLFPDGENNGDTKRKRKAEPVA